MEWTDINFSRQYQKDINIIFRNFSNLQPVTQEEIKYIEEYIANPEALPCKSLETLVDIALEKWLERI